MIKMKSKKIGIITLSFIVWFVSCLNVLGADIKTVNETLEKTTTYLKSTVKEPEIGSIGGEWLILGLCQGEANISKSYYDAYYKKVEQQVKECKGVLSSRKYTEYSRVILALTAIGKTPTNVGGYNLLLPLGDYEKTNLQGLNGAIWALIALDSNNYEIPQNPQAKMQATRQMYVDKILKGQLADGGFALSSKGDSELDMTAMALVALSNYQDQDAVKKAIEKGVTYLSKCQDKDGGFKSFGEKNAESDAQVLMALNTLGISMQDPRFVKDGHDIVSHLLTFKMNDGSFKHVQSAAKSDQMATEQSYLALIAAKRSLENKSSLFQLKAEPIQKSDQTVAKTSK